MIHWYHPGRPNYNNFMRVCHTFVMAITCCTGYCAWSTMNTFQRNSCLIGSPNQWTVSGSCPVINPCICDSSIKLNIFVYFYRIRPGNFSGYRCGLNPGYPDITGSRGGPAWVSVFSGIKHGEGKGEHWRKTIKNLCIIRRTGDSGRWTTGNKCSYWKIAQNRARPATAVIRDPGGAGPSRIVKVKLWVWPVIPGTGQVPVLNNDPAVNAKVAGKNSMIKVIAEQMIIFIFLFFMLFALR